MTVFSPTGTARLRFLLRRVDAKASDPLPQVSTTPRPGRGRSVGDDGDAIEPAYLGWEMARCARGLDPRAQEALAAVAAACVAAIQAGSTRIPVDEARLPIALEAVGKRSDTSAALSLLARARQGDPAVCSVIGGPGDCRPLVLDGEWLSTERMCALEESFCHRVRSRVTSGASFEDARAWQRAVAAIADGPPPLTAEQKRAVRESLARPLALVTGGPGTGKTTIVVALLRALAWAGVPMGQVAIAAPTGKAAQRLEESIGRGSRARLATSRTPLS